MDKFEAKLDELLEVLNEQEEIKRFIAIENELQKNDFIKNKIEEFKKFQKKLAIYEYRNNKVPDEVSKEYDAVYKKLTEIPLINEYLILQQEINDMIKQITEIIESEINN